MATTTELTNVELAQKIRSGDHWAIVVLCNRIKPKTLTELQEHVYGARWMSKEAFDRLADAFNVYAPDVYAQPIGEYS